MRSSSSLISTGLHECRSRLLVSACVGTHHLEIILANLTAMSLTASADYWELVDILAVIIGGM